MFGLGFAEVAIIAVIALIFIGPKQLPEVMKGVGKFVREITKAKEDFKNTVDSDDSLNSIRNSVDSVKDDIKGRVDQVKADVMSSVNPDDESKG